MSDTRLNRQRHEELATIVANHPNRFGGATTSALAVTTTQATYPTTASTFYAMNAQSINGSQVEGNTALLVTDTTSVFFAWNAGTQIPPSGTTVVVHSVGGNWMFRYDG
jgi:hypothetical protein